VRLSAKVKLLPDPAQAKALDQLLRTANKACNRLSECAWESKEFGQYNLHKARYAEARELFGLPAQVAVRCISKVADSYKLDKKVRRTFRPLGSVAFDDRNLTWYVEKQTVSIGTLTGRIKLAFAAGDRQLSLLASRQGESDLIFHRGNWYLTATCNVEEPKPSDADDFLGVDFGIANIAADSDGRRYSGSAVKSVRHRQRRLRTKLQKKVTTSANRRLKKLAGKEQRFATHTNHVISKQIVATAKGTGRGIALEDLSGILDRVKVRHGQRVVLHSWAFLQLKMFVLYKAALAGVLVVQVDPRNSSRECSQCGHIDKANRPSQSVFSCRQCFFSANADFNAARVLSGRGKVNCPHAAVGFQPTDPQSYRLSAG
jgi:putative transposase